MRGLESSAGVAFGLAAQPLYVTTKPGVVYVVNNGKLDQDPFLGLSGRVNPAGSEQGMLSIAFAPGYADNSRSYAA